MSSATPAPVTAAKPLAFMEKLDPLVSFYQPPESEAASTSAEHQPRLIIVATWTDARDAHIAKYVAKYQALYPNAQILLLKSTMSCILRPSQIGLAMKHAASVVHAAFPTPVSPSSPPPLLVHIFSQGGSSSMAELYEQFSAMAGSDKRLPPHVTIFDSSPGLFRIPRAVAFISVGLSSLQQLVAMPFLYTWAVVWTAAMAIGILPNSLGDWSKSHNHHIGNTSEMRRVYIYSTADAITEYKDIEAHAAEAEAKGFSVTLEKYVGSAHVSHSRKDEGRYWGIVKSAL